MNGVDLLDRMLGTYHPKLRNKKQRWNLYVNALNMTVVVGWFLYSSTHSKYTTLSHLEFYREFTVALLRIAPRKNRPRTVHYHISRRKSNCHFLVQKTQGRCAQYTVNSRVDFNECNIKLHLKCVSLYRRLKCKLKVFQFL